MQNSTSLFVIRRLSWPSILVNVLLVCLGNYPMELHAQQTIKTYCNPLPIPNYPLGRFARDLRAKDAGPEWMWLEGRRQTFRELADVSALWDRGLWILYPSVDMAWVSSDFGGTWNHHPLNVRDIGYAPTVVKHRDKYLLMASNSPIYESDSPLGPFHVQSEVRLPVDRKIPGLVDPMLYSTEDGQLFLYWGCTANQGIWGVELDSNDYGKPIGSPRELIPFDPKTFSWEGVGQWNQNPKTGWMEGAWMLYHNGMYYLTYSAGGTENRTYAMGCYTSPTPLGPFSPQQLNPILRTTDGLVTGTAHGSIVKGPGDEYWAFYTIRAGSVHAFERRIGMDRARFTGDHQLVVGTATSTPQPLPTTFPTAQVEELVFPLNHGLKTLGSSDAPNLSGRFAVDDDMRTWWTPAEDDALPTLTTTFIAPSIINSYRIIWRDVSIPENEVGFAPVQYYIEVESTDGKWQMLSDRRKNDRALLIDYQEVDARIGGKVRLVITNRKENNELSVAELTLFGTTAP